MINDSIFSTVSSVQSRAQDLRGTVVSPGTRRRRRARRTTR